MTFERISVNFRKRRKDQRLELPDRYKVGSSKGPSGEHSTRSLQVKKRVYSGRFLLPDPTKASFGARLRYLRRRLGLTIEEFSKTTGLSHGAISRIVNPK